MGNCLRQKYQYQQEVVTMMTGYNGDDFKVDDDCSQRINKIIQEEFQDQKPQNEILQPNFSLNAEIEKKQ